MSVLQALQRKNLDSPTASEPRVVAFDAAGKRNLPPDLLGSGITIGSPRSAFDGQPNSSIGTALPDVETGLTAGAKPNADT